MLHLDIVALGKLKEAYWREAEAEYLKRLSPFAKVTIHELKEEPFGEKDSLELIKKKEAEKILLELAKIKNSFIIILDERGKEFSSVELTEQINKRAMEQLNNLTFIIGGPLGLHQTILAKADLKLSLSRLTFTHQMARVFLLEQMYRAMMITAGRTYHH